MLTLWQTKEILHPNAWHVLPGHFKKKIAPGDMGVPPGAKAQ